MMYETGASITICHPEARSSCAMPPMLRDDYPMFAMPLTLAKEPARSAVESD